MLLFQFCQHFTVKWKTCTTLFLNPLQIDLKALSLQGRLISHFKCLVTQMPVLSPSFSFYLLVVCSRFVNGRQPMKWYFLITKHSISPLVPYYCTFWHMRLYSNIGTRKRNIDNIGAPAFSINSQNPFCYSRMHQKERLYDMCIICRCCFAQIHSWRASERGSHYPLWYNWWGKNYIYSQ